jgi:hypothetical protein
MTTAPSPNAIAISCECQSSEAAGAGFVPLYVGNYENDVELGWCMLFGRNPDAFRRWPTDWDLANRMNIETTRDWRFDSVVTGIAIFQAALLVTYNSITFSCAGNVTGYTGSPTDTLTVYAHRSDTGEVVGSTTVVPDGAYTITVWDNTIKHYTETKDPDGTLVGRSDNGTPA